MELVGCIFHDVNVQIANGEPMMSGFCSASEAGMFCRC